MHLLWFVSGKRQAEFFRYTNILLGSVYSHQKQSNYYLHCLSPSSCKCEHLFLDTVQRLHDFLCIASTCWWHNYLESLGFIPEPCNPTLLCGILALQFWYVCIQVTLSGISNCPFKRSVFDQWCSNCLYEPKQLPWKPVQHTEPLEWCTIYACIWGQCSCNLGNCMEAVVRTWQM